MKYSSFLLLRLCAPTIGILNPCVYGQLKTGLIVKTRTNKCVSFSFFNIQVYNITSTLNNSVSLRSIKNPILASRYGNPLNAKIILTDTRV